MIHDGPRGHDMGGQPAGRIVRDEHELDPWEVRADALGEVLWGKTALIKVDELRRLREDIGPDAYERMTYYERWMHSLAQGLIEHGIVSVKELGQAMERAASPDVRPLKNPGTNNPGG